MTKLPDYLGGYDYDQKKNLVFNPPEFMPGFQSALATQMSQGFGSAPMETSFGLKINPQNGQPMMGQKAGTGVAYMSNPNLQPVMNGQMVGVTPASPSMPGFSAMPLGGVTDVPVQNPTGPTAADMLPYVSPTPPKPVVTDPVVTPPAVVVKPKPKPKPVANSMAKTRSYYSGGANTRNPNPNEVWVGNHWEAKGSKNGKPWTGNKKSSRW